MLDLRGYAAIGLRRPKTPANVGSALRAAECFGAKLFVFDGRMPKGRLLTDVNKFHRHVPMIRVDDIYNAAPYDCVPVAVEMTDWSNNLVNYKHPMRAMYIFGNESMGLSKSDLARCVNVIQIPTNRSLNLAAAVNIVLYDRVMKQLTGKAQYV